MGDPMHTEGVYHVRVIKTTPESGKNQLYRVRVAAGLAVSL